MKTNYGMSLLEVLIAIAIMAFMSVSIISNTKSSFDIRDKVTTVNQDRLRVYTAFNLIEWDFSQIYSPLFFSRKFEMDKLGINIKDRSDPLFQLKENLQASINSQYRGNPLFYMPSEKGIPVPRYKQPDKFTFEFFASSHRRALQNSKESNYAWVVYTLEDPTDKDIEYWREYKSEEAAEKLESNLVRYVTNLDPFSNEDIDFGKLKGQVIMENVKEIEFSFWDSDKEKFLKLESTLEGKGWVQAMKVRIIYIDNYGEEVEIERIFRHLWPLYNPIEEETNQAAPTSSSSFQQNQSNLSGQGGGP